MTQALSFLWIPAASTNFWIRSKTWRPKIKRELITIGKTTLSRMTTQPGFRLSVDAKEMFTTGLCPFPHFSILISGQIRVKMADGKEFDVKHGNALYLPPGHDVWVVGDEPAVSIEIQAAE